jgi:hypothetical protein
MYRAFSALILLAGCVPPPDLPASPVAGSAVQSLVPLEPILAAAETTGPDSPETDLALRANALRSRAADLRLAQ